MNICKTLSIISSIGVALLVAVAAQGGPPIGGDQGIVKLVSDADGQFFFADVDDDLLWTGATDKKFRIEGGALTGVLFVQGDMSGNGQTQLGLANNQKFYFESGNFGWTPGSDAGDINFFFAGNVGLIQVDTGDWNAGGRDCVMKVGTDQFIFVDVNCNNAWDGTPTDAKFRIEGGGLTGIYFVKDDQIGIMTSSKWYLESGNFGWTPASDAGDINGFFASGAGTVVAVMITDFNGDGTEDFAKIIDDGFIYADLNGNMAWDGATDGKFKIEGGSLTGPYLAGTFQGQDGAIGQFSNVKVYVDGNASNAPDDAWTPGAGTETVNFFAPGTGSIQGAGAGSYGTPD